MRNSSMLPPLVALGLRYASGDRVRTPFGSGVVSSCSDRRMHVEVALTAGGVLYARRETLVPEFRMLACGEIPKETQVLCGRNETREEQEQTSRDVETLHRGVVQCYLLKDEMYQVRMDSSDDNAKECLELYAKHELRYASGTRVSVLRCLGTVREYRHAYDTYVVQLDCGAVGYLTPDTLSVIDLRLLSMIPKPTSADSIFKQFEGRITREDASALHLKAMNTYRMAQTLCEEHAELISLLSTNIAYSSQYSRLLSSVLDPSIAEAARSLAVAGTKELDKLKGIAESAKSRLEREFLDGRDVSTFFSQAAIILSRLKESSEVRELQASIQTKAQEGYGEVRDRVTLVEEASQNQRLVLSQVVEELEAQVHGKSEKIKKSLDRDSVLGTLQRHEPDMLKAQIALQQVHEAASKQLGVVSIADLAPAELLAKAEELLPNLTSKAELLQVSGERLLDQLQQTPQGQSILTQAKQLVQSVENPDAFCGNVQQAIANVKLDKIAEWGTTLTSNRQKRQEFIDRMKDQCVDFFMSVLPAIKIDTIEGVEEGVKYSIAGLDLSNFRLQKQYVKVRMGTVVDEELFTVRATHLSALLKGFRWTFAQQFFPYLNGGGLADAQLDGGMIELGFKAEKKVVNASTSEFRPTLALNSMVIEVRQDLKLTVHGSWFSAFYNLLTTLFADLIRDYIAKTLENKLLRHMIQLLDKLNDQMDKYWPVVFQLLDVRVEDLPTAAPWRGAKEVEIQPHEIDVEFRVRSTVPFTFAKSVLNRYVVVNQLLELEPHLLPDTALQHVPVGGSVVAINGMSCQKLTLDEFKSLLNSLTLPFTLRFSLIPEDTSSYSRRVIAKPQYFSVVYKDRGPFGLRLRSRPLSPYGAIVLGFTDTAEGTSSGAAKHDGRVQPGHILVQVNDIDLRFKQLAEILTILKETTRRPATLKFAASPDGVVRLHEWPPMIEMEDSDEDAGDGRSYVVISAFSRVPSFAQRTHLVQRGDILWKMNDVVMTSPAQHSFAEILETMQRMIDEKKPIRAVFVPRDEYVAHVAQRDQETIATSSLNEAASSSKACDQAFTTPKEVLFPEAPLGILFGNWNDQAAFIRMFISSAGSAEKSNLLRIGHAIVQVNGKNVPTDATPVTVEHMIRDEMATPPYSLSFRDLDLEHELFKI